MTHPRRDLPAIRVVHCCASCSRELHQISHPCSRELCPLQRKSTVKQELTHVSKQNPTTTDSTNNTKPPISSLHEQQNTAGEEKERIPCESKADRAYKIAEWWWKNFP